MGVLAEYKYYFLECWGWESRLKIDVSTGAQYGLPNLSTHIKSNGTSYLGQIFNETDWLIWFRLWVLTQAEAIITMWTLKKNCHFLTLLQCSIPEGNLHCQCILSIFPASVHQFYATILVFVNINPFLYTNDQFALMNISTQYIFFSPRVIWVKKLDLFWCKKLWLEPDSRVTIWLSWVNQFHKKIQPWTPLSPWPL